MSNINVSNKKTFGKKTRQGLIITALGVGMYFSWPAIQSIYQNIKESGKIDLIIEEFDNNKPEDARKLIEEFEQKKIINEEAITKLKSTYVEKKNETNLDNLETKVYFHINKNNLDSAKILIEQLKKSSFYSSNEITEMKNNVEKHTEDYLKNIFTSDNINDITIASANDYLNRYPKGQHRGKAAAIEIYSSFYDLNEKIETEEDIEQITAYLERINDELQKYSKEKATISNLEVIKDAKNNLRNYISELSNPQEMTIDARVKITNPSSAMWNNEYYRERSFIIPTGSEGTIKKIAEEDKSIYVEFDEITKNMWKTEWSFLDTYKDGNVAKYKVSEVTQLPEITSKQKNNFLKELNKMELNLKQYR